MHMDQSSATQLHVLFVHYPIHHHSHPLVNSLPIKTWLYGDCKQTYTLTKNYVVVGGPWGVQAVRAHTRYSLTAT